MIVEPMKDKNGKVITNVQLVKICYNQLVKLRDGVGCKTDIEREQSEDRFYRICGGSTNADEVMKYMKQIVDEPDEIKAQRLLARTLLPVK